MRIQLSILVGALIVIGVLGVTAFNVRGTAAQPAPSVFLPFVANQTSGPSVSLVDFMFLPKVLHVSVGSTVIWTNTTTTTQHTVTSDSPAFDSGVLNPGLKFSFTFTTPGTYAYHCQFHGSIGMIGTIVVGP